MTEPKAVAEPLERFGVADEETNMDRKPSNIAESMHVCLHTID